MPIVKNDESANIETDLSKKSDINFSVKPLNEENIKNGVDNSLKTE